ncbi:MAG: triose-phosphate isomerase [Actinobacteria bacterium]|nr:MAG: triose-phosphate isomerase [Actinomycetota bacterium]
MDRKPVIAGNWKMNMTTSAAVKLVQDLEYKLEDKGNLDVDVIVCPPFTSLRSVSTVFEYDKPKIAVGAQNMHWEEKGAFTGEISPLMLKDLAIRYAIIGHSERRQYFSETDEMVNKKIKSALNHKITPIVCVGETLEEREENKTQDKIKKQVIAALEGLQGLEVRKLVFAYEPIWAIGTGQTATPEQANDVIRFIRATIASASEPEDATHVRILYGGSVTADNIKSLMAEPEIDGALVGGASLEAESFAGIVLGARHS